MKTKQKRADVYRNKYMTIFADGTMGLSDGVGYLDTLDTKEVRVLYDALKAVLTKKEERK